MGLSPKVQNNLQAAPVEWMVAAHIKENRPWASLYPAPPPPPPGILPRGNIWVPWPSKYTVQVVCKWAVAVCVCGAGSNNGTVWNSKLRWPCLLATHLLWQKRPFPYIILLFEQFNMLQLSVPLCLKCVLVIGHCGRRNIKDPSDKNPELTNVFP